MKNVREFFFFQCFWKGLCSENAWTWPHSRACPHLHTEWGWDEIFKYLNNHYKEKKGSIHVKITSFFMFLQHGLYWCFAAVVDLFLSQPPCNIFPHQIWQHIFLFFTKQKFSVSPSIASLSINQSRLSFKQFVTIDFSLNYLTESQLLLELTFNFPDQLFQFQYPDWKRKSD